MGLFLWTLAAAAGYAGYRGYRKLQAIDEELRREVAGGNLADEGGETVGEEGERQAAANGQGFARSPGNLEARILRRVQENPGILQTELYGLFPGEKRRLLQECLRDMDRTGVLERVREAATYKLSPR